MQVAEVRGPDGITLVRKSSKSMFSTAVVQPTDIVHGCYIEIGQDSLLSPSLYLLVSSSFLGLFAYGDA
jgi:hypothetical protein